jgi:NAD(P)-dependent dehydrogenase (short-subunit alcohol dehydrogenase family)
VAFTYVSAADKAQAVAKQVDADGGTVLAIQADNADPGAVTAAVEQTVQQLGGIDILVNNAGIIEAGPLKELTVAQADHHHRQRPGRTGPDPRHDPVLHGQVRADRPDPGPGP